MQTEAPHGQQVPYTLRQRHAAIHQQAVLSAVQRPPTRDPYGYDDGSDADEEGGFSAQGEQGMEGGGQG